VLPDGKGAINNLPFSSAPKYRVEEPESEPKYIPPGPPVCV